MGKQSLPYFSTRTADDLYSARLKNKAKYLEEDFSKEIQEPGACLELPVRIDLDALAGLNAAATEYENSLLVWNALRALTPSLACENRIWTRLCHGEALEYSRARWLQGAKPDDLVSAIGIHMFASTQTMCRDDNALGRLWWGAYIAFRTDPEDFEGTLALILKSADIRSNFVERTWMTTRRSVASAIIRCMKSEPWIIGSEKNFRETMKALNVEGAGISFEVMTKTKIDEVVMRAVEKARTEVAGSASR